jgi:hypothetical protein
MLWKCPLTPTDRVIIMVSKGDLQLNITFTVSSLLEVRDGLKSEMRVWHLAFRPPGSL